MPPLSPSQLHLWLCQTSQLSPAFLASAPAIYLNTEETARYQRFKFEQHKTAFLASRILLKTCLAEYLQCAFADIRFTFNAQGKPELHPDINPNGLYFNLSHSGDFSVVALHTQPIGIDTEKLDRKTDMLNIARHNFHPLEITQLENTENSALGFYVWMLKEAYIKQIGKGLSHPLREFYFQITQTALQFGSNTHTAPLPSAALVKLADLCVAAVCHTPAKLEWCGFQVQDEGKVAPADVAWLAKTACPADC